LIDAWDRSRGFISSPSEITTVQKEAVLRHIAFEFHKSGKGELPRELLEDVVTRIAKELSLSEPPQKLLEDIERRSALLVERSIGIFGFSHLTLQEYLVAKHIHLNPALYRQHLVGNFENKDWREVVLLYSGLLDDSTDLVEKLRQSDSLSQHFLAAYCIGEAQHVDQNVTTSVCEFLLESLQTHAGSREVVIDALAGIASDYDGEPRNPRQRLAATLIALLSSQSPEASVASIILGKARVRTALSELVNALDSARSAELQSAAVEAIEQFGNLALPAIRRAVEIGSPRLSLDTIISVLSRIGTGDAVRLLIQLYNTGIDQDSDLLISVAIANLMRNYDVLDEMLALQSDEIPEGLRTLAGMRPQWSYPKHPAPGFLCLE